MDPTTHMVLGAQDWTKVMNDLHKCQGLAKFARTYGIV